MAKSIPCDNQPGIRVVHIADNLKEDVTNISCHIGITRSKFIGRVVNDLLNSYPSEMSERKICEKYTDIDTTGISPKAIARLNILAGNIGIGASNLLKVELARISASNPAHMKMAMDK